jgi:hypothetical protein
MADRACDECKNRKRRCDKGLPECGLCRRTGRACQYNEPANPRPTASHLAALQSRLEEIEGRLASASPRKPSIPEQSDTLASSADPASGGSGLAAAALFLDLDCFVWAQLRLPVPEIAIPVVGWPPSGGSDPLHLFLYAGIYLSSAMRGPDAAWLTPTPGCPRPSHAWDCRSRLVPGLFRHHPCLDALRVQEAHGNGHLRA